MPTAETICPSLFRPGNTIQPLKNSPPVAVNKPSCLSKPRVVPPDTVLDLGMCLPRVRSHIPIEPVDFNASGIRGDCLTNDFAFLFI